MFFNNFFLNFDIFFINLDLHFFGFENVLPKLILFSIIGNYIININYILFVEMC